MNKILNKQGHSCTSGNPSTTCHFLNKFYLRNQKSQYKMPYLADAQGMTRECGRSMVEMLGVLAIIGVLSIAGISGYSSAIRQHRANEIVQAINHIVIEAQSANSGSGITSDLFYPYTKPSGLVELAVSRGGVISVVLGNDLALCKLLENRFGTATTNSIYVKIPCTNTEMKNLKLQIKDPGF